MANEDKRKSSKDSYEVGYGKPPKDTRFKPGQSGNRKGRPKGTKNFATDVRATLASKVRVTRDGSSRKISTQEAMLMRLREKALGGDVRAIDQLVGLARTYNNEDLAETAGLSANDAEILEIYQKRVVAGAAGVVDAAEASAQNHGRPPPGRSTDPGPGHDESKKSKPREKLVRRHLNDSKKGKN
ncbi:MAG: DUF5681 domain-containing protein [Hyphomicrobiales bacterium]|nr:DUF5681 domain-containing protein [Hyphomicrobiales bacterium]